MKEIITKKRNNKKEGLIEETNPYIYMDLAPSDDADKNGEYFNALSQAINNKRILNLAVTGIYGSGKTSVLNTFKRKCSGKTSIFDKIPYWKSKFKFLNISLSSYAIERTCKDKPKPYLGREQEIEKSILQQLFYRVKPSHLPFSRFSRIKHHSNIALVMACIIIVTFIMLSIFIINPNLIDGISTNLNLVLTKTLAANKDPIDSNIYYIFISITTIMFSAVLYQIVKYIVSRVKISKIGFNSFEIEVDKNDKSIFNKYLDEILYFFQVEKYNVVLIEDLDRFGNTEVFIKLRELNTLINNSDQVAHKVTFVYAVKDEMFCDKERTKFFDFILPIIPVVDSSNSEAKIKELIRNKAEFRLLDDEFVNDISIYINDMRILICILNEFVVYSKKLNIKELQTHDAKKNILNCNV